MNQLSQKNSSNKSIANLIMKNMREVLHSGSVNTSVLNKGKL